MAKDVDDLIAEVAEARRVAQHVNEVDSSVRRLARVANENLEKAEKELRTEVRRRVEEITPPKDGDRTF